MELCSCLAYSKRVLYVDLVQDQAMPPHQDTNPSKVFCPVCVANGYAATTKSKDKDWFLTGNSVGGAIWNTSIPRLQLGIGLHSSNRAIRGLISYRAVEIPKNELGVNIGYGFQSQETGSTGYSTTLEWNPKVQKGSLNVFMGVSRLIEDAKLRPVAGVKWSPDHNWAIGNQHDGRAHNPFIQRTVGDYSIGIILIAGRTASLSFGVGF